MDSLIKFAKQYWWVGALIAVGVVALFVFVL